MSFDAGKARQAMQEWAYAFVILWAPMLLAFMSGFRVGDGPDQTTIVPNLTAVKGFMVATLGAAMLSFLKALFWYMTGTKVPEKR